MSWYQVVPRYRADEKVWEDVHFSGCNHCYGPPHVAIGPAKDRRVTLLIFSHICLKFGIPTDL